MGELKRRVEKLESATGGCDGECCQCPGVGPHIIIREAGKADKENGPTVCERCGRPLDVLIITIVREDWRPAWKQKEVVCGDG